MAVRGHEKDEKELDLFACQVEKMLHFRIQAKARLGNKNTMDYYPFFRPEEWNLTSSQQNQLAVPSKRSKNEVGAKKIILRHCFAAFCFPSTDLGPQTSSQILSCYSI